MQSNAWLTSKHTVTYTFNIEINLYALTHALGYSQFLFEQIWVLHENKYF